MIRIHRAAALMVVLAACKDDPATATNASTSIEGYGTFVKDSEITCEAPLPDILAHLTGTAPFDYLELRQQTVEREGPTAKLTALEASGTACQAASDRARCMATLAAATLPDEAGAGWVPGGDTKLSFDRYKSCCEEKRAFLVMTSGDDVTILSRTSEVARFVGTVDTIEKARLLVSTTTRLLDCTPGVFRDGWTKNADGSWFVLTHYRSCSDTIRDQMRVDADGTVTLVAQASTNLSTDGACSH